MIETRNELLLLIYTDMNESWIYIDKWRNQCKNTKYKFTWFHVYDSLEKAKLQRHYTYQWFSEVGEGDPEYVTHGEYF